MGPERHSSKNSQSSLSGLRSITRDFSENTSSSQKRESSYNASVSQAQDKVSEARQLRLKAIQDALNGVSSSQPNPPTQKPLAQSRAFNKRPSDPSVFNDDAEPPVKKKRELPSDWKTGAPAAPKGSVTTRTVPGMKATVIQELPGSKTDTAHKPPKVYLSQEQTEILKLVEDGTSVFYTGSAGTGKSVLLREIIKTLKKKFGKNSDVVAITASTGIAACNIGGVTIHSFAGIGLGIEPAKELASKVRKNKKASGRWARTKVLIIDEVSMVDGDLFDKLAEIGTLLRKNPKPFGGIQLIVTGDFFQLPPVTKSSNSVKFAFEAQYWPQVIQRTFNLTKVFRQRDQEFVDMLNEMRFGKLSAKSITRFRQLSRPIEYDDGLGPTELFPRREDVERSNGTRLLRLQDEEEITYKATDSGAVEGEQREKLLNNFMAPRDLRLRLNAQVMLIKNIDESLVNGSMGRVVEFRYPGDLDDQDGSSKPSSSAGSTTKSTKSAKMQQKYPVVEFLISGGGKARVMLTPESFKVELPSGEIQAQRLQFPLILAWAMSIHKSQGQTLERVKVDLGRVFEKGQAYVALSRATCIDGLQVLNFDPRKVEAHPKVVQWTRTLEILTSPEFEEDASWTL